MEQLLVACAPRGLSDLQASVLPPAQLPLFSRRAGEMLFKRHAAGVSQRRLLLVLQAKAQEEGRGGSAPRVSAAWCMLPANRISASCRCLCLVGCTRWQPMHVNTKLCCMACRLCRWYSVAPASLPAGRLTLHCCLPPAALQRQDAGGAVLPLQHAAGAALPGGLELLQRWAVF